MLSGGVSAWSHHRSFSARLGLGAGEIGREMKTQHRMDTGRRKSKEKSRENYLGSQKESRGDTTGNKENMNYMDARRI
jgi:hypothetical protein